MARLLEYFLPPSKKTADTGFLVQVLHLINPSDPVFASDYVYERPQKVRAQVAFPLMNNADGFYSGLPQLKPNSKGKGGR